MTVLVKGVILMPKTSCQLAPTSTPDCPSPALSNC